MPPKKKKPNHLAEFVKDHAGRLQELNWNSAADIPASDVRLAYGYDEEGSPFVKHEACRRKAAGQENTSAGRGKREECNADACSGRTFCLEHMGQSLWMDREKALKSFLKVHGVGGDPSKHRRDVDIPVGLKNLGATCYANSYLQCWFQNLDFRAGVFRCPVTIPTGSNVTIEDLPLFQLQVTFAALQQGATSVFNPQPLVKSLRLDEGEQQDATEFGKLFMTLLDYEFKKQADLSLKTLVTDLFEGRIEYGTRCHQCNNTSENTTSFLELEITLKGGCTLTDQLDKMLADEILTGQNQYMCSRCESLQDATRFVNLKALPPVLHFSLLRFVFDEKTFDRRKTNATIKYPPVLDLSAVCQESGSANGGAIYDLKGVLLHKGTSAHHGHYVAQVYDEQRKKWFLCDDTEIQPITSILSKKAAPKSGSSKTTKRVKADANGVVDLTRDADSDETPPDPGENGYASSKDAYMLIYTRRMPDSENKSKPEPQPLQPVFDRVEEFAASFEKSIDYYQERKAQLTIEFEQQLEQRKKIWESWNVVEDDEATYFVSKAALQEWMERGVKPIPKKTVKAVTNGAAKEEKVAEPNGVDKEDKSEKCKGKDPETRASSLSPLKETPPPENAETNGEDALMNGAEHPAHSNGNNEAIDALTTISNSAIVCIHGRLDPAKAEQSKQISQMAVINFDEIGVTISPVVTSDNALCDKCVWSRLTAGIYESTHRKAVKDFKTGDKIVVDDRPCWISQKWLSDWLKISPEMHEPETGQDPPPDSLPWRDDTTCEHGNLKPSLAQRRRVSTSASKVLHRIFPDWRPFLVSDAKCAVCKGSEIDIGDVELRKLAATEKSSLSQLANGPDRLHAWIVSCNSVYYILPKDWVKIWKAWIRNPITNDRAEGLDMASFLCQHNLVLFDVNVKAERDEWTLITAAEMASFKQFYSVENEIELVVQDDIDVFLTNPMPCKSCREEKLREFEQADIVVRCLNESDFDASGVKLPTVSDSSNPSIDGDSATEPKRTLKRLRPIEEPGRLSRSRRTRSAKKDDERQQQAFTISKSDTVKDLKVQIYKAWSIATIYQRLFMGDRELENTETMESIRILAGGIIECYEQPVGDEATALANLNNSTDSPRRKKARPEGFRSTGLHGFEAESASESEMDVDIPPVEEEKLEPKALSVTCPQCTFDNIIVDGVDVLQCEMCNNPFV